MKKIILFLIAVGNAFAASAPKTHDGLFINFAMGFGFQSIDYVLSDYQKKAIGESGMATDIDIKIGGKVGNNLLMHLTLTGVTQTESFNGINERGERIQYSPNLSLFGIGATYYFLDNFLATASLGLAQFHANEDVATFYGSVHTNPGPGETTGLGFQIAGGKEWWIADEWGVGATASILYGFAVNLEDARESAFSFAIRLSVTFN